MKRLLSFVLSISLAFSVLSVCDITVNAQSDFEYDEKTKTLTLYSTVSGEDNPFNKYGEKIENLIICEDVTNIDSEQLSYCTSISNIIVDEDNENYVTDGQGMLLSSDESVLIMCSDTENIKIPRSVTKIEDGAFVSCRSLAKIEVDEDNPEFSSDQFGVLFNKDKTMLIRYPDELEMESYAIPDSVIVIYDSAFEDSDNLTSMFIPSGVTTIGESAFEDCDGITTLTLCYGLEYIGDYAFLDCTEFPELVIPDSVTYLGEGAFEDCTGLKTVVIGKGLEVINESAFEDCDEIISLTLGENIRVIGEYAFYDCHSINELVIPDSVTEICEGAFEDDDGLVSLTIGDSVTIIGRSAFEDCDSLKFVAIPESVTTLGENAFYDCYSLESIVVGKNISSVGTLTFSGCYNLLNFYFTGSQTDWASTHHVIRNFVDMMNATVYYNCSQDGEAYRFEILSPSRYAINYKNGIVLHSNDNGMLPDSARVEWTADNDKFAIESAEDGKTLTIISQKNGFTKITATVFDADGVAIAMDTIEMRSKAGFSDKISSFFRSIFGLTKIYEK